MEEKVLSIIEILKSKYPDPVCALHYTKDYELMIAGVIRMEVAREDLFDGAWLCRHVRGGDLHTVRLL